MRCVTDRPWITVAETCECALAHLAVGDRQTAETLFGWAQQFRRRRRPLLDRHRLPRRGPLPRRRAHHLHRGLRRAGRRRPRRRPPPPARSSSRRPASSPRSCSSPTTCSHSGRARQVTVKGATATERRGRHTPRRCCGCPSVTPRGAVVRQSTSGVLLRTTVRDRTTPALSPGRVPCTGAPPRGNAARRCSSARQARARRRRSGVVGVATPSCGRPAADTARQLATPRCL